MKSLAKPRPICGNFVFFMFSYFFSPPSPAQPLAVCPSLFLVPLCLHPRGKCFWSMKNGETETDFWNCWVFIFEDILWNRGKTSNTIRIWPLKLHWEELKAMFALNEKYTSLKCVAPHLVSFLRSSSHYFLCLNMHRTSKPVCDTRRPCSFHEFSHQGHFTLTFIIYVSQWYCAW